MGARQSKRSVDISGKEAEGGNEVAAAGAGGEGRVEALADVDALKPQLNGDAHTPHIEPPTEQNDKEKQLDSGTPENEKDATTEKESKEDGDKEESSPVTNGESEAKPENGETTPAAEEGKKPKKEKVKKKWSLRSISFSRKDKPKQEKKSKDDDAKTNGEPEKVPEEAAEVTSPEATESSPAQDGAPAAAAAAADGASDAGKEQQTPDTPVTEPITNGSAPASPASPAEPAPAPHPDALPVNGLSLEEKTDTTPEVVKTEEVKPEEPIVESTETAPAPEIPVKTEVCVERMPSIEPTPPPLPANPPPSSVVSFAASTMAPELTDASLANTAPLLPAGDVTEHAAPAPNTDTQTLTETLPPLKETTVDSETPAEPELVAVPDAPAPEVTPIEHGSSDVVAPVKISIVDEVITKIDSLELTSTPLEIAPEPETVVTAEAPLVVDDAPADLPSAPVDEPLVSPTASSPSEELPPPPETISPEQPASLELPVSIPTELDSTLEIQPVASEPQTFSTETAKDIEPVVPSDIPIVADINVASTAGKTSESVCDLPSPSDELPPPPPPEDMDVESEVASVAEVTQATTQVIDEIVQEAQNAVMESNHVLENGIHNGVHNEQNGDVAIKNLKNISKDLEVATVECNGGDVKTKLEASEQQCQELADKMAELIPEIPTLPEIKSETETSSDVAVAN